MATTMNFKDTIDLPEWRPLAVSPNASAAGMSLSCDLRTHSHRHTEIWQVVSNTVCNSYNTTQDGWGFQFAPGLAGTFGAGANSVQTMYSFTGVIDAGSTTTQVILKTLPVTVIKTALAWTRTTTTATITQTTHGMANGQLIEVTTTSDASAIPLGTYTIAGVAASTYTITCNNAGGASGTVSARQVAKVGINNMTRRGGGEIRVIGNSAGGSGLVEERTIIAHNETIVSGGTGVATAISCTLDFPLSFTPAAGDTFEITSPRLYMCGAGTTAAGSWKVYDVLTNTLCANLSTTNFWTAATSSCFVALDETYIPNNRNKSSGFLDDGYGVSLTATASGATSITGMTSVGDYAVLANEYRNYQIRIVKDTAIPTAVGQRRKITSHTAGPNPAYTVPAWTVTPSTDASYVIEMSNEILGWCSVAGASTYTYNQELDTWSTSTYGASGGVTAAGTTAVIAFGVPTTKYLSDPNKNFRYSQIFRFRGNSVTLDVLDIAAGTNGVWSNAIVYDGLGTSLTAGTSGIYEPNANGTGHYFYINIANGQQVYRFNAFARYLSAWAQLRYAQGAALEGVKMARGTYFDGTTCIATTYLMRSSGTELFGCLISR